MRGGQMETPARGQAQPGQKSRFANAAGFSTVPHGTADCHLHGTPYRVVTTVGDAFVIRVKGRVRWALNQLRDAGMRGCTPILDPAPRWSAYVFSLRELGVEIDTVRQEHDGDFPGHHGRYVLRSVVSPAVGEALV
jgi:hypothetical protein